MFDYSGETASAAKIIPYRLVFKRPAGTSRGVLYHKDTWFLIIKKDGRKGVGEVAMFRGLSAEEHKGFDEKLQWLEKNIFLPAEIIFKELQGFPSIIFGLEQALLSLHSDDPFLLFPSAFTQGEQGIPINGLIWMGDKDFMLRQIDKKIRTGFGVIKMKIGAIDFETELEILAYIRQHYGHKDLEIRVDANGAFSLAEALEKLERLAEFDVHSIEQPIRPGQWEEMARLCELSPVPVALDEELIGYTGDKRRFLEVIRPRYIILKPSLHGGMSGSDDWITAAEKTGAGWWITSALESNVGLNAIAQYTWFKGVNRPQGLGTGSLFTNNIASPLEVSEGALHYRPDRQWQFPWL